MKNKKSRGGGREKDKRSKSDCRKKTKSPKRYRQQTLFDMKTRTRCSICGQVGHWRGDPECPVVGQSTINQHGFRKKKRLRSVGVVAQS